MTVSRPAAFLDRDGVLNEDRGYVHDASQFVLTRGAADAVRLCNDAGYLVFVVTNQSGIARGYYDEAALASLHRHMVAIFAEQGARIDDIRYCPHHPQGVVPEYQRACPCRKPEPGMIWDLSRTWSVDTGRSFLIGDKPSDMAAAAAAGIPGYPFTGGDLSVLVRQVLGEQSRRAVA